MKDGAVLTLTTHIPRLDIVGLQSKIKAFFGKTEIIWILYLNIQIYDKYLYVIYVSDNPHTVYRSEDILGEWLD